MLLLNMLNCLTVTCQCGELCFLKVKQEMAYLARRIDEVGRYFLALESMLGSYGMSSATLFLLKHVENSERTMFSWSCHHVLQL